MEAQEYPDGQHEVSERGRERLSLMSLMSFMSLMSNCGTFTDEVIILLIMTYSMIFCRYIASHC